jgi:hypothetical protein
MTAIREYLYIAAIVILVSAFGLYTWHERHVGEHVIEKQDTQATAKVQAETQVETQALQTQSDTAEDNAKHDQELVDSYIAAHPLNLSLCDKDSSRRLVSQASPAASQPSRTESGPVALPAVPASPDVVTDGLTELVSAASRLAVINTEFQQR